MKGRVIQFRRGRHTIHKRHFIIEVEGYDSREKAKSLVGREVVWLSPYKKEIRGRISAHHGNKGLVRAIFEKGLPGQALGTGVEIKEVSKGNKTGMN